MVRLSDSQRQTLGTLASEIDRYIQAAEGEEYADSITADPRTFKQLLQVENRAERTYRAYLKDLAPRLADAVNWSEYRRKSAAEDDPMVSAAAQLIDNDTKVLIEISFAFFEEAENLGAQAAGTINKIPLDFQTIQQVVQRQAIRYSGKFVSGIDATTLKQLQQALRTSLDLKETVDQAHARVIEIIDNPVRAHMIARTEPVNMYGRGVVVFGENTGAKKKIWDSVIDNRTSKICIELQDKYGTQEKAQDIGKKYTWSAAGGGSTMQPGAHVLCRSGHWLLY